MRMLSGTAVWVDSAPNEMQVDLSPCQHLSLPSQSLIQRQQTERGLTASLFPLQANSLSLSLSTYVSINVLCVFIYSSFQLSIYLAIYPLVHSSKCSPPPCPLWMCVSADSVILLYLQATCTSVLLCNKAPTRFLTMQR